MEAMDVATEGVAPIGDIEVLTLPKSYYREMWGAKMEVITRLYDTQENQFVDRNVRWQQKDPSENYVVTKVRVGPGAVFRVEDHSSQPNDQGRLTVLWQSPHKVLFTTEEDTLIGAVVTPLFSTEIKFDWYKDRDGQWERVEAEGPFIEVGPGTYTARITFAEQEQTGLLGTIKVQTPKDFYEGVTILEGSEYECSKKTSLGKGSFGVVYKGKYDDKRVAVKEITTHNTVVLRAEIEIASKLKHEHLVKVHGACFYSEQVDIVMELVHGQDLAMMMEHLQKGETSLTPQRKAYIIQQVCRGLSYMHKRWIVHSDVKPANIMVDKSDCVKVTDYSFARMKENASSESTDISSPEPVISPFYRAPELWDPEKDKKRQPAVDIWAIGLVIIELFNDGQSAWHPLPEQDIIDRIEEEDYFPDCVAELPPRIADIVRSALNRNRKERPSADDVDKAVGTLDGYREEDFFHDPVVSEIPPPMPASSEYVSRTNPDLRVMHQFFY